MTLHATVRSGLPDVHELRWGTHLCQLYRDREDLVETLVPFFRAGLLGNERCLWIAAEPLPAAEARGALAAAVDDLVDRERCGQIEILDHHEWYLRAGRLSPEQVAEAWLEREAEALRLGFAGLRLSGNTSVVERDDWESFAAYEERVHRAFHGRRIVALCSYALERCGTDRVLEVLRSHDSALMRNGNGWKAVRSATQVLAGGGNGHPRAGAGPAPGHSVQFYDDEYGAASIAELLGAALRRDAGALAIATPDHQTAIAEALAAAGIDPGGAVERGHLVLLDAAETLESVCEDGEPRTDLLRRHVGPVLDHLAACCGDVRAYVEMVDLLAGAGRIEAAVALERSWNEVLTGYPVRLLCGYHLDAFDLDRDSEGFRSVCDVHADVHALEPAAEPALSHGRLVAELRQRSRIARVAAEQLARLQSVTAALSEVTVSAEVVRLVGDEVRRAVGADEAMLAVVRDEGGGAGRPAAALEAAEAAAEAGALEDAARKALATGKAAWQSAPAKPRHRGTGEDPEAGRPRALACLPVASAGRRLGALAFGWREERGFSPADRALLHDVARQVGVALDRARLYEAADRAREEAERASGAKDEFLAMLGHELRNPLAPITTTLELMRLRAGGVLDRERGVIERQVSHLLRLVEDLLDVSRITRGMVQLERSRNEISEVVAQAIETVGPLLEERRHRLVLAVPSKGLAVDGDPARLAQVIANLLGNAAKFTPGGGGGRLEVTAYAEGEEAVVRVVDNGVGIAPELLPSIFDSFSQGPRPRDRSEGGLGLGLAIVRSLVELHDGSVAADSAGPGRGAEFSVRLPLAARQLALATAAPAAASPGTAGAGLRVLVVDDNVDGARTLAELLETMGCETDLAHDGPSALVAVQECEPELVLLDIGLPVMDGYEVAARLRELAGMGGLAIVAVTGYGQPADRARSAAAGFDDHLVKPLMPERLRELVDRLSDDGEAEATA